MGQDVFLESGQTEQRVRAIPPLRTAVSGGAAVSRSGGLTLADSEYALSALVALGEGDKTAYDVLGSLLRKVRPMMLPRVSGS
jgi:hypothetical protein